MRMLSLVIWIVNFTNLTHGHDSEEYFPGEKGSEVPPAGDSLRGSDPVSSVDDLVELFYPEYSLVQHCLRQKALRTSSPLHAEDDIWTWAKPREMPQYKYDASIIEVILEEIQRTMCSPREVCLEVSKEYPESTSHSYRPRCVSVHRCGGCCHHEGLYCTNTSYTYVNKTLLEISHLDGSVVMVAFINHTSCQCLSKRPLHSVIRRAAAAHRTVCSPPDVPCSTGLVWDLNSCLCVPVEASFYSERELEPLESALLALCGPNKVLDEDSCDCVCQNGLTEASCGQGRRLDQETCECLCEKQPTSGTCPPNQLWDPGLCGCVCRAECPRSQPLNPETCLCQCRESPHTCLRQGKRFIAQNCSCYREPCRKPHKNCPSGQYYSHTVCQCMPNYMRSGEWN
ncbi:vascular endothelial growth factor C [Esox lucius]|uniref:Platelet-derived growth factor (PDGF) family profile domain-containing protein n=1 Tax=Esox lucius TaxID=8010 RepID=A0A6Q2WVQ5_ESOLU|nr:vascular endothelial growth factor C [Esox lucius]